MLLFELVPEVHERLGHEFARDAQVRIRAQDGYARLKAVLPPPERRGLVLIARRTRRRREFTEAFKALKTAHPRWATGTYALWYPIKDRARRWREAARALRRQRHAQRCCAPNSWSIPRTPPSG